MGSFTPARSELPPAVLSTSANQKMQPSSPSPASSVLRPSKPIIKPMAAARVAAGQKRKMTDMSISPPSSPSSLMASDGGRQDAAAPRKRARIVQFESEIESRPLSPALTEGAELEKSAAVVREEIRRAIQRHASGTDSDAYDRVKEIFAIDPKRVEEDGSIPDNLPTHTTLKHHLMGLLSNVASLDRNCAGLVHTILHSEWLGRDESYVRLFVRFLGNLAAAQGGHLRSVLKMLVGYLGEVPRGTGKLPGYSIVQGDEIYNRVHMALRYLMQLIPAASGTLSPLLSMQFPFDTDSAKANVAYTKNLIKLIEYTPELQSDILALIAEKLVKIDVQIQVDMEDFEDEVGDDLLENLSRPLAEDEEASENESVISDDDDMDEDARRVKTVRDGIRKLDSMIDVMFDFYSAPFAGGSLVDQENTLDLLLSHFKTIILPTYRSRHLQFLLFHFSQTSPILVDRFIATCMQMIFSKSQPPIMRQSAAAYLASFVARGAHVSSDVVRDVFDMLGNHLNNLRVEYEPNCRGPDLRRYGQFYSTAQALLYVFCFRWRDLTTAASEDGVDGEEDVDNEDVTFPPSVKEVLHRAIYSRLNPLKVCSPAIVAEFARIAHHLRFMYLFSLLDSNKRLRMSSHRSLAALADPRFSQVERETRAGDDTGYQLDAYFPFDPYQLPRSRRWLEGDYVQWRGIPGVDEEDGDDSDSAMEEDDDDEGEETDHPPTATDEED